MPESVLDGYGRCRQTCLCEKESLSMDVCTPPVGCDIRSSVAYMVAIRDSLVDELLDAPGIIDWYILQGFKQSYVVPAMIHQSKERYRSEVTKDKTFREHCLRG